MENLLPLSDDELEWIAQQTRRRNNNNTVLLHVPSLPVYLQYALAEHFATIREETDAEMRDICVYITRGVDMKRTMRWWIDCFRIASFEYGENEEMQHVTAMTCVTRHPDRCLRKNGELL